MWVYQRPENPFFNHDEFEQITVLLNGIFPPGETNPGASDADAATYLTYLLADPTVYYEIATWQIMYRTALPWLSEVTQTMFGKELQTISADECATLLKGLMAGTLSGAPAGFDQKQFFLILRGHCIEGCFADQRWGGNKSNLIWQWYGYPTGPASDFNRGATPPLSPVNVAPEHVPVLSGNAATAAKETLAMESATVLPLLLAEAVTEQSKRKKH
jgi:gluconate 2-dehydrogenase gamma chain